MAAATRSEASPATRAAHARKPALDGLRGIAVAAVVVNHLRPNALPGGWLGVDVFFVLSGYLITSLLLTERTATGRIDLGRFYSRRARRLLPALFLVLVGVTVAARLAPDAPGFNDLRYDGLSALAYVANWHFIASGAKYFNALTPSPLQHLWSLSIEEQFYLAWPIALVLVLRRGRARTVGVVALGARDRIGRAHGPRIPRHCEHPACLLRHGHPRARCPSGLRARRPRPCRRGSGGTRRR